MRELVGFLLLISLTLAGCRDPVAERKIDPYLKVKMEELAKKKELDQKIPILFKVTDEISSTHKLVLRKKGIEIQANIAHLYTASATPKAIYELAKMRFVSSVEASKELKRQIQTQLE